MPIKDYVELDEEDFYGQGFEQEGVVSVWVRFGDGTGVPEECDVLQDLCGVGYYDLDQQAANCFDFQMVSVRRLLEEMSYSNTFIAAAITAAKAKGIESAHWAVAKFGFAYDQTA